MSYETCVTEGMGKIITAPCKTCGHALMLHTITDHKEICSLCLIREEIAEQVRVVVREEIEKHQWDALRTS